MARKVLSFIGLSILLFSCLSQDKTQESVIDVGWSIVEDSDRIALQDYYSHSHYVVISIPEEQPFYTADKIQSGDGKYFLGDIDLENTILIVDDQGQFISQIETGGNGPGEVPRMEDFVFHPDRNSLLILTGWKIFEFSTTGEFLNVISLPSGDLFHFIAYGGENKVWLYTLPFPSEQLPSDEFRMLTLYDLDDDEKVYSYLEVPEGLRAEVSGEKELTLQHGRVILTPAHGSRAYSVSIKGDDSDYVITRFSSLPQTQNLFGLQDLGEYFEKLQDDRGIAFLDNYIDSEEFSLFMMIKDGLYPRWGVLEKRTNTLYLTQSLFDSNLGLPLLPYLDVQDKKVFKLLDSEYFYEILEQDIDGQVSGKLKANVPQLMNQENKLLLCIYEN
ncbi:6-bladed beta-propeller [Algoriphagus marincola]|uniref:6-bladed beta-propeller n=1 Tax=Algoriphagus marincola TaxID=264027 RepID=UPI00047E169A|nr:6-bladed beta-propeller [Algoriphagus marincola]